MLKRFLQYLESPVPIAPLAGFRMLFGAAMLVSVVRFMLKGWVTELYVTPEYHFPYWGFEWVKPLGETGLYLVFVLMAISALGICLGAFYRVSAVVFFLTWTYVELLDKTYYLNHYYFVSLVAFLLIWLPAHRNYSVDAGRLPQKARTQIPRWTVGIIRLQLGMVYFFAGIAKLNPDWLVRAMPLKIWLPSKSNLPIIGSLLNKTWVAFAFSWAGALFDLLAPFLLLFKKTRWMAYAAVVSFHLLTGWLFPIGMFPIIMIFSTWVFFPASFHEKWLGWIWKKKEETKAPVLANRRTWAVLMGIFFAIQTLLPFRYLLYPDHLFWTEEGFRFSWRVMLMEKAGYAIFRVKDPSTGKSAEIINGKYLTPLQEKMMATQPDMILQFAHWIRDDYEKQGIERPEVYAEVYVTLNGSGSRPFVDSNVNLAELNDTWCHRNWVLPFEKGSSKLNLPED